MRVLLDTNVILDFVLERDPHFEAAAELFELNAQEEFQGFFSSITAINVFYIGRKFVGAEKARERISDLLVAFEVCPVGESTLRAALGLPFGDYEDAVQQTSAIEMGLEAIVTRDLHDYKYSTLPVFSPDGFLQHLKSNQQDQA